MSTKARSLYSKHLTDEQFRTIASYRDVPSIASFLKNETRYNESLDGINDSTIHREVLEQKVRQQGQIEFVRLMRFVRNDRADFYKYYTKRREIEQILMVMHSIESGVDHQLNFYIEELNNLLSFDIHDLARCKTFVELHDFLDTTDYKGLLDNILDEVVDINHSEDILNEYYRKFLNQLISKESNKKEVQELFDIDDELTTVGHVYRLKKYYDAKPEEILPRLRYRSYLIPKRRMEEWIQTLDADGFLEAFHQSGYGKYASIPETVDIELHLNSIRCTMMKHYLRFATNTNLTLCAYMMLMHIEIDNIIDVIEGVRYQMHPEAILKLLTR